MQEIKDKFVGRFVGPDKIEDIEIADFTTPLGSTVFKVTFLTGQTEFLAEKGLVTIVSDEPKDFNHVRDSRVQALVPQLADMVLEYDFPSVQLVHVLGQVGDVLKNRMHRAQSFLLHGTDDRFVPGFDPETDMTGMDAQRVISKIPPKTDDA